MTTEKTEIGVTKESLIIDATTHSVLPTLPKKIELATPLDVRREMATVYRQTKAGKIDTADGAKLVYMLAQVGKMIELHEIEARLSALENNGAKQLPPPSRKA